MVSLDKYASICLEVEREAEAKSLCTSSSWDKRGWKRRGIGRIQ
jgi:hypothetical protein